MRKQTLFSVNSDTQKSTYITPNQKIVELDMESLVAQSPSGDGTYAGGGTGEDTEEEDTEKDVKAFKFELW